MTARDIDPEVAKQLLVEGATFVLLDMPVGSEFGIDMESYRTGEKFRGVKLIPPGVHFIYYSAVDKESALAPRMGFFHEFKSKEMFVKKWDKRAEAISEEPVSEEEVYRLQSNLRGDLDRFLGAYPYGLWRRWVALTNFITPQVVQQFQPTGVIIYSVQQFVPGTYPPPEGLRDTSGLPELTEVAETGLRFTEIPKKRYPDSSNASEITKYSMDTSFVLKQLFDMYQDPHMLLGELQFSFVCFLVGQLYNGFEQWKRLFKLFCNADAVIALHEKLFLDFITVIHFQLKEIPSDFFVDIVSQENILTNNLTTFFKIVAEGDCSSELKQRAKGFQANLTTRFNWDFDAELEDEKPVVVELEPPAPSAPPAEPAQPTDADMKEC